jgi:fibro-slime domain-containing protein
MKKLLQLFNTRNKLLRLLMTSIVTGIFVVYMPVFMSLNAQTNTPTEIVLQGTLRDFKATHPDFEENTVSGGFQYGVDPGIVQNVIGSDRKPIYVGQGPKKSTSNTTNFNQWYTDVPDVNTKMTYPITLADPDGDKIYTYNNQNFFPLDGKLFGNEGRSHNYHFTYEIHSQFTYIPGTSTKPRKFKFIGDDDVWVYINDKRVIDLGGVHGAATQEINIDSLATSLGLVSGRTYKFDFFFAERHTTQSTFQIETSIAFNDAD